MSLSHSFMSDVPYDIVKVNEAKTDEEREKAENKYEYISSLDYHTFAGPFDKGKNKSLDKLEEIYYSLPTKTYEPITGYGYGDIEIVKLSDIKDILNKIKECKVTNMRARGTKKYVIKHLETTINYMEKHYLDIVYYGAA